ncbi:hypothetical protein B4Q13_17030 [Lacticaseibacillus rhamnosus]
MVDEQPGQRYQPKGVIAPGLYFPSREILDFRAEAEAGVGVIDLADVVLPIQGEQHLLVQRHVAEVADPAFLIAGVKEPQLGVVGVVGIQHEATEVDRPASYEGRYIA